MTSVERLAAIPDPEERARSCARRLSRLDAEAEAVREIRDEAVVTLLLGGRRPAEVARVIGVSRGFMSYYRDRMPVTIAAVG